MKSTTTYTSILPTELIKQLNDLSIRLNIPENKILENSLRKHLEELRVKGVPSHLEGEPITEEGSARTNESKPLSTDQLLELLSESSRQLDEGFSFTTDEARAFLSAWKQRKK